MTSGYSGTQLAKKLGIKPGTRVFLHAAPAGFREMLEASADCVGAREQKLDLALVFVTRLADLRRELPKAVRRLAPAGMLWIAWPKKTAGVATNLSFDKVQNFGLAKGLVDTKICAIDEKWSGLKFVRRLKDR